jgi:hypothetical protein
VFKNNEKNVVNGNEKAKKEEYLLFPPQTKSGDPVEIAVHTLRVGEIIPRIRLANRLRPGTVIEQMTLIVNLLVDVGDQNPIVLDQVPDARRKWKFIGVFQATTCADKDKLKWILLLSD